jgi:UDP-N-acetylglucosamine 2-epimerase (non-hydrolysing)
MKLLHVVGARPNFMKLAPVVRAVGKYPGIEQPIVHTGQHFDATMSDIFFQQLGIPAPTISLAAGTSTQISQAAEIMVKLETAFLRERPDIVVVYGDVTSTLAAALVCAKNGIKSAHVEAGLRSFDRSMPEEINRVIIDQISDYLFTPSDDAAHNLGREGVPLSKVHFVGNVMIDTLARLLSQAKAPAIALEDRYVLVTLHRPSNVDNPVELESIMKALGDLSSQVQVIFPMHPRTRKRLAEFGLDLPQNDRLLLIDPLGYLEFLGLQQGAVAVITDSGGVQEETTYLRVPCLTLRENTERPVTLTFGSNRLLGRDYARLQREMAQILEGKGRRGEVPPLWDGKAGERIARILTANA